jgi:hypothetical protein
MRLGDSDPHDAGVRRRRTAHGVAADQCDVVAGQS